MTISEFAEAYADYLSGAAYGQMGNDPKTDLPAEVAEIIRSCVGLGHQAAVAVNDVDYVYFAHCRETFKKNIPLGERYGLTYGQMDLAWQAGYNKVGHKKLSF